MEFVYRPAIDSCLQLKNITSVSYHLFANVRRESGMPCDVEGWLGDVHVWTTDGNKSGGQRWTLPMFCKKLSSMLYFKTYHWTFQIINDIIGSRAGSILGLNDSGPQSPFQLPLVPGNAHIFTHFSQIPIYDALSSIYFNFFQLYFSFLLCCICFRRIQ